MPSMTQTKHTSYCHDRIEDDHASGFDACTGRIVDLLAELDLVGYLLSSDDRSTTTLVIAGHGEVDGPALDQLIASLTALRAQVTE